MNLKQMADRIHKMAVKKGWWDDPIVHAEQCPMVMRRSIGDQFANFHAEISEAWEEYRNGHAMNEIYYNDGPDDGKPEGVPIELADCIIRILDTCEQYGIDIEEAIKIKVEYNSGRPYRHGGKLA
jgi:NTP pyrophosphatase (non-canonical NTP hydrolase)